MSEQIKKKYEQVGNILENAIVKSREVNLIGEEENIELDNINKVLEELNESFKIEIMKLEKSSEWDKFCISFFGETNAGKSTIVESLRIIYDEEVRREALLKGAEEYKISLKEHSFAYEGMVKELEKLNLTLMDKSKKRISKNIIATIKIVGYIFVGFILGYIIANLGII